MSICVSFEIFHQAELKYAFFLSILDPISTKIKIDKITHKLHLDENFTIIYLYTLFLWLILISLQNENTV